MICCACSACKASLGSQVREQEYDIWHHHHDQLPSKDSVAETMSPANVLCLAAVITSEQEKTSAETMSKRFVVYATCGNHFQNNFN